MTISENGKVLGRHRIGTKQHHFTCFLKPMEFDQLKYLSAGSGKSCSTFICDKLISYMARNPDKKPTLYEREDKYKKTGDKIGSIKSFTFEDSCFQAVKSYCAKVNITMTDLILSVVLLNQ